ncbi:hypothetical protein [Sphingomonas sp.]|uniref:hypothetical protein n=1 Tax=Sphingomonas sp. TaxID=28214 RepID=UPI0035C87C5A
MRLLGIFITACVILAAAQATAAVLVLFVLIGLVYSLFTAPRETLGLLGLMVVAGLIQAQPLAFLGVLALLVVMRLRH